MKQREYVEGPEAFANFERFAKTVLQAKPTAKTKQRPKDAPLRKSEKSDKA